MPSTLAMPNTQNAPFPIAIDNPAIEFQIGAQDNSGPKKPLVQIEESEANLGTSFALFASKMRREGLPLPAIHAFRHYYEQLQEGADGYLSSQQAQPVMSLPRLAEGNAYWQTGYTALKETVTIKLNGGLGTSMGMQGPKSLIQVKKGLSFLDIAARQVFVLRRKHKVSLPLLLMNSFSTDKQTQAALKAYENTKYQMPVSFVQNKVPKIWQDDLTPVTWPQDVSKEWCPPGHGDIYLALQTSGMLKKILTEGYQYAFISNIDNLGATIDLNILGYMVSQSIPFLLEAARRLPTDSKGGHLAQKPNGGLILREVTQCPPEELVHFQDIQRYCYFNTNNLWIHLPSLQRLLERCQGVLPLPLLRNEKPVDPVHPTSRGVYQLETAMGHAISLFAGSQAIEVTRDRFFPVKTTNDLLALWSDVYLLNNKYSISLNPDRQQREPITIDLDKKYYGMFHQLKARFPHHVPSLVNCSRLQVKGNIYFDADLLFEGDVSIQQVGDTPVQLKSTPFTMSEYKG